ncbi:hypothetical protein PR002_g12501 [Phytophthora rubi]|uniref:Uncharacterized protein n=1 Tax=Phytophthora rubi TaxID=129364 RepID=A0A6A3LQV9_9STRA|nr:hypothetical protein PR002_g12501 [Phytophthora rubi]
MAAIAVSSKESEDAYGDFIRRRRARGELSIRTLEGFRRLQKRYGQLVTKGALSGPVVTSSNETSKETEGAAAELRNVVDVLFNPKISRVITETCWCLAHFGGGDDRKDQKECASLILDAEKYSTFNFRLLQWVFPELPRKEAQQLVQRDWEHDLEFDERQGDGLSLHGFKLSLVDLVVSCTDGTVNKCLEFLNLMTRWLQHSLPPYPTRDMVPQVVKDLVEATKTITAESKHTKSAPAPIVWQTISLSMMTPCHIGQEGLYCELKAKVCSAPLAIMVLAADEK